jgi:hypothetical protein
MVVPVVPDNPCQFYAVINAREPVVEIVTLIMPLGGPESGLFRFPKVGDRVLVSMPESDDSGACYLMGYIPDTTGADFEPDADAKRDKLFDKRGEIFRYKKTGANKSADDYSEIGFYNEETAWKAADDKAPPRVDRVKVRSTGDIDIQAENYHKTRAKRVEILADADGVTDSGARPFGDKAGDDSSLYAGDAHIRAKTRVVVKAGEEIRLEVGRSAVIISDSGITLTTRKAITDAANPWDTVLTLTPRDGVTLFGQRVDIGAGWDFSLREAGGGSISSFAGVMRLTATDLLAQSYGKYAYQANMTDLDKTVKRAVNAMKTPDGKLPSYTALLPSVSDLFANTDWGLLSSGVNYSDPVGDYTNYCALLLQILSVTLTVEELTMPEDVRESAGGRDEFNLAALQKQYELIREMMDNLADAAEPERETLNSFLHLTASADAVLCGYAIKHFSFEQTDAAAPKAGVNEPLIKKEKARLDKANQADATLDGIVRDAKAHKAMDAFWALDVNEDKLRELREL